MIKHFTLFVLVLLLSILNLKAEENIVHKNVIPFAIDVKNNLARVSTSADPRHLYLELSGENSVLYLELLNNSLNNKTPINLYMFRNTSEIISVSNTTQNEINVFRAEVLNRSISMSSSNATLDSIIPIDVIGELLDDFYMYNIYSIPFDFVEFGCEARAHKMAQVIKNRGYACQKYWIRGNLAAWHHDTQCCPRWAFHIAPLVKVRMSDNSIVYRIIDPSVSLRNDGFSTIEEWEQACLNANCVRNPHIVDRKILPGEVYKIGNDYHSYEYDNDYSSTNYTLSLGRYWQPNDYCELKIIGPDTIYRDEHVEFRVSYTGCTYPYSRLCLDHEEDTYWGAYSDLEFRDNPARINYVYQGSSSATRNVVDVYTANLTAKKTVCVLPSRTSTRSTEKFNNPLSAQTSSENALRSTAGIQNAIEGGSVASIKVYSLTGSLIYSSGSVASDFNIYSLGLNDGIYIVETTDETGDVKRDKLLIRR